MKKLMLVSVIVLFGVGVVILIEELLGRFGYPGLATLSSVLGIGLVAFLAIRISEK